MDVTRQLSSGQLTRGQLIEFFKNKAKVIALLTLIVTRAASNLDHFSLRKQEQWLHRWGLHYPAHTIKKRLSISDLLAAYKVQG